MNYPVFRKKLDALRPDVLTLVQNVEHALERNIPIDTCELAKSYPDLPFSKRIWDIWLLNTRKLRGVKRRDHLPYATHPTRMAAICCWQSDEMATSVEDAAVLAILHDYLEEGDGLTPQGLEQLKADIPSEPDGHRAAVLLSEPMIDYHQFGSELEKPFWQRVAYVIQVLDTISQAGHVAFANASVADKIDNLHDLNYIQNDSRLTSEKRIRKLSERLGYFRFIEQMLGLHASPSLLLWLTAGIEERRKEFGVTDAQVATQTERLHAMYDANKERMVPLIQSYQKKMGV